jgi:arsenate reductase
LPDLANFAAQKVRQGGQRYNCPSGFAILCALCSSDPQGLSVLITVYGIKNCDTVKKARKWLEEQGVDFRFHDFRQDGLEPASVESWLKELGWENLVNRRSTSWKALDENARNNMDATSALAAILEQPTLIKRPLLDTGKQRFTGFSAANYEKIFSAHNL